LTGIRKKEGQDKFEDTKGAIRIRKSKNRQHNGQKTEEQTTQWPKDRRTNNTMAKRQKNRQHNSQKTEEQTTQWLKGKGQKDKQRFSKHTHKTKDRVTRTPSEEI
jgi:hypothetical protein